MYSLMQLIKLIVEAFVEITALISSFQRIIETLEGMKERMYVNGVKCDICDKMHNMNILKEDLPKGWFVLVETGNDERKHFCSLECLRLWIPKHPVASEFVGQDEEPKVTLSDRVY